LSTIYLTLLQKSFAQETDKLYQRHFISPKTHRIDSQIALSVSLIARSKLEVSYVDGVDDFECKDLQEHKIINVLAQNLQGYVIPRDEFELSTTKASAASNKANTRKSQ
jgi:hypothetical protein